MERTKSGAVAPKLATGYSFFDESSKVEMDYEKIPELKFQEVKGEGIPKEFSLLKIISTGKFSPRDLQEDNFLKRIMKLVKVSEGRKILDGKEIKIPYLVEDDQKIKIILDLMKSRKVPKNFTYIIGRIGIEREVFQVTRFENATTLCRVGRERVINDPASGWVNYVIIKKI